MKMCQDFSPFYKKWSKMSNSELYTEMNKIIDKYNAYSDKDVEIKKNLEEITQELEKYIINNNNLKK